MRGEPVLEDFFQLAIDEIFQTYGDRVIVNRKSLSKFGRNESVGTSEEDITTLGGTENYLSSNGIDTISSDNAGDTGTVSLEGVTISGNILTFSTQTATLDGQNKVTLTTPIRSCTRMRGTVTGNVYVYEDTAITSGVPDDLTKAHNVLVGGDNTSLRAATSIQSTNYFILTNVWASLGRASGSAAADIRLKRRVVGTAFNTEMVRSISISKDLEKPYRPFFLIPPNSDIDMTAVASSGTLDITAGFHGFFADIIT
jgi:hypothetical protein